MNDALKAIGYWIEELEDEDFPAPQELVGTMDSAHRVAVADYLDSGTTFEKYRGYSWCRFGCDCDSREMGSRDLTDGVWVWPEGLSHYVRKHGVLLPVEFIAHTLLGKTASETGLKSTPDFSFWREWCRERRSPVILERLRAARIVAKKQAADALQERIAAEIARYGLSEVPCIWKSCNRNALAGMSVCAKHSLAGKPQELLRCSNVLLLRDAIGVQP